MENKHEFNTFNPGVDRILNSTYPIKRKIRTREAREGLHNGKKVTLYPEDKIKVYEDTREYHKLFAEGFESICLLSKRARIVLKYIMFERLRFEDTEFVFSTKECAAFVKLSEISVIKAMKELKEEAWIFNGKGRFYYWINPQFIFKGDINSTIERRVAVRKSISKLEDII